jgi:hypothetical protein
VPAPEHYWAVQEWSSQGDRLVHQLWLGASCTVSGCFGGVYVCCWGVMRGTACGTAAHVALPEWHGVLAVQPLHLQLLCPPACQWACGPACQRVPSCR